MGRWWFIRHGQSEANAGDWLAGHRDVALTARGRQEALAVAPIVASLPIRRIVTSDLRRAWHTAVLAWGDRPGHIERHAGLRERHLGGWEGVAIADLRAAGAMETLLSWRGRPPGGESHRDLGERVLRWLAFHDDGRDTAAFLHGGLIRVVEGLLDGVAPEEIGRRRVANTEIVTRDVPAGRWATLLEELPH